MLTEGVRSEKLVVFTRSDFQELLLITRFNKRSCTRANYSHALLLGQLVRLIIFITREINATLLTQTLPIIKLSLICQYLIKHLHLLIHILHIRLRYRPCSLWYRRAFCLLKWTLLRLERTNRIEFDSDTHIAIVRVMASVH